MNGIILTRDNIYKGNLILINANHPIVLNINRQFVPVDADYVDVLLEQKTAAILMHILRDIGSTNQIVPVSGYRSREAQEQIYSDSLREYGIEFTGKYVALPNHSEHQTGLAVDLGIRKDLIDFIRPDFPYEGISDVFRRNAPKYGFVERYQKTKESITGISHEPWHFRYVGYPHSEIMQNYGLSLEEYTDFLKWFPFDGKHLKTESSNNLFEIYYVSLSAVKQITIPTSEAAIYEVSGNNVDGCIITEWRSGS